MNIFRRLSSRSLAALLAAFAAVAALAAVIAVAAFGGSGATPPPEPLDQAIHGALAGTPPAGVSAQITFVNHLFDSSGLGAIAALSGSPLLNGGSGRLWMTADGKLRIELPTDSGATEIVFDGTTLSLYDSTSNTAYELPVPAASDAAASAPALPGLAQIDALLAALAPYASLSGATPDSVAGQPAYTVTATPVSSGGLVGSAALSFDAATGVPLHLALDARGSTTPVLELTVTGITYGAVPDSDVLVPPPAGAKIVTLKAPSTGASPGGSAPAVSGLDAVAQAVPFTLVAPPSLDGLTRGDVRLVGSGASAGALVSYGEGLGALLLSERPASGQAADSAGLLDLLPGVSIDGSTAHELTTPLGTILSFDRAGVSYTLAGSVGQSDAETAARALAP